jgi:Permuted papain-like amidase enzyme, YaeF/YiiX, C92 family
MMKILFRILAAIILLYLILMIPFTSENPVRLTTTERPFEWGSDTLWSKLETDFEHLNANHDTNISTQLINYQNQTDSLIQLISNNGNALLSPAADSLLISFFNYSILIPIQPSFTDSLYARYKKIRVAVKEIQQLLPDDIHTKRSIYKLLYGTRAAMEEIILQLPKKSDALMIFDSGNEDPSGINVHGLQIKSGDVLLSRGSASVSALIARASNFPGNFSHVALLHINETNKNISVIESHIEKGVAIADSTAYFKDKKQRVLVLRKRFTNDKMLAHKAAGAMLEKLSKQSIPYDFSMDFQDADRMFCSEVASYAYSTQGIELWSVPSGISHPGAVSWLNSFGVQYFSTQMPSDLEYDKEMMLITEWYDRDLLWEDHVYNAAMDALYEQAKRGLKPEALSWLLPVARVLKGWSFVKNKLGYIGPIPEGMNATTALKNMWLTKNHEDLVQKIKASATEFQKTKGYLPPYWQLVKMANIHAAEKFSTK